MLYRRQSLNLHTQNREERDGRGEEIKCDKTSLIYQKLVQKKDPQTQNQKTKKPPNYH